jgi:hypothetical protein
MLQNPWKQLNLSAVKVKDESSYEWDILENLHNTSEELLDTKHNFQEFESNKLDGDTNYNVWKFKARAVLHRENM